VRFASLTLLLAIACGDDSSDVDAGAALDSGATEADGGPFDADIRRVDSGPDGGPFDAGPEPPTAERLCDGVDPGPFPEPDAWGPNHGPGGPVVTFTEDELWENCTFLTGHESDIQHHNLLTMYDGYLLMPWSPESGGGGITLWDISDPCAPVERGVGLSETMRETHAIGFAHHGDGAWAVVDHMDPIALTFGAGGVEIWDVSDTSAPAKVSEMDVPGFFYPDAYTRVSLSVFWQAPFLYVGAADNGVYIGDATDPRNPGLVTEYGFEPTLRVGQVQAIGNLLVVTAAEGARAVLLDIGDPTSPMPIPGGDFLAHDGEGTVREAYFTNVAGGYLWFARKDSGGGIIVYDITDPTNPTFAGDIASDGSGGYVFVKDEYAFEGVGRGAGGIVFDVSDLENITEYGRVHLEGDLDTLTPIGNVLFPSVDADANPGEGTAVAPWQLEPDTRAPTVTWSWPADGATDLPVTSRIGLTFSEFIDAKSAFEGSVRLTETATGDRVPAVISAQEVMVNVHPRCPLEPGTSYTLTVVAGGVVDFNGNAVEEEFTMEITTAD